MKGTGKKVWVCAGFAHKRHVHFGDLCRSFSLPQRLGWHLKGRDTEDGRFPDEVISRARKQKTLWRSSLAISILPEINESQTKPSNKTQLWNPGSFQQKKTQMYIQHNVTLWKEVMLPNTNALKPQTTINYICFTQNCIKATALGKNVHNATAC